MNYSISQLLQEARDLPPIPQAVQRALTLIYNPESNASELAAILSTDQALAAKVLRWANSAYYGIENRIVTIQQAIVVLGMNILQELVLTYSVSDHLNRPLPGYALLRGELWEHALGTAIGAKLISKQRHLRLDEEAYFSGLMCDIGKLILERLLREIDFSNSEWRQQSFLYLERTKFGVDHAMLGAEMARRWQLPESLVAAIAYHHEPQAAPDHQSLVAAVHVADVSMTILGIGIGLDGLHYPLNPEALKCLEMTWEDLFPLAEQVTSQLTEAKRLIHFE